MPSTSLAPSLTIGFRRAEMTAFWILSTAVLSVVLVLGSAVLGIGTPWVWGAASLGVLLPGLVWPRWFEIGIRAWNKGARLSAAILRAYVLRVCYYLLFGAVGRTGSSLNLELGDAEMSRWLPRRPEDRIGDRGPLAVGGGARDRIWRAATTSRKNALGQAPGTIWTASLLPILMLLRVLRDEEQESAPPSSTYTLY